MILHQLNVYNPFAYSFYPLLARSCISLRPHINKPCDVTFPYLKITNEQSAKLFLYICAQSYKKNFGPIYAPNFFKIYSMSVYLKLVLRSSTKALKIHSGNRSTGECSSVKSQQLRTLTSHVWVERLEPKISPLQAIDSPVPQRHKRSSKPQ